MFDDYHTVCALLLIFSGMVNVHTFLLEVNDLLSFRLRFQALFVGVHLLDYKFGGVHF
jgi:hypothetical protein